ncbi:hypothetical protein [Collinsella aerofaciens]|uniref:hypothetical protein n=1 Tax=Collinsella aerofaciens TaxID=74426 RepID=UPI00359CAD49
MRNYNQIKTVASAPPRKLIPIGKVISATGLVLAIVGLFSALSSSANIYGSLSLTFLLFGLFFFVDGLLLVITASKQQEKLLGLHQSILEDDPQIAASAEEFMSQRKALTQQGEITGIFIVHNASKDLYYVGHSTKAIDRAAIQFLGRGNCDVYADYKYGDSFSVRIIPLLGSGYESLNEFKRAAIQALETADEGLY